MKMKKTKSLNSCKLLSEKSVTNNAKYWKILILAFPAILNNLVRMLMLVVNIIFIGYLNNPALVAGVGLGNMTINIFGLAIIMGFNTVLDTLIS